MNTQPAPRSEDVAANAARPGDAARRLDELASVIRSKNAGPAQLTIDIFLRDDAAYAAACASPALSEAACAQLYGVAARDVRRYLLPDIRAIKFSLPRATVAGTPGDGDVYGAQQHAPLLGVLV